MSSLGLASAGRMRRPAETSPNERALAKSIIRRTSARLHPRFGHRNKGCDEGGPDSLRRRGLMCLLVGVAALASWWPRGGGPIDLRWDGGAYYILGTSLARGDGYRLRSEPGDLPSSLHPPLVPAIVALHQFALQTADPVVVGRALRVTLALCSAAYAIAVFLLLSASLPLALCRRPSRSSASSSRSTSTSRTPSTPKGCSASSRCSSSSCARWRRDALGFVLCGVCAVLAYEARTAGIALLAAWVVDHALRKEDRRALVALVVSAVVVTSWNGWIKAVESSPEYRQPGVRLPDGGLALLQRQLRAQSADVLRSLVSRARAADAERLRPPGDGEPQRSCRRTSARRSAAGGRRDELAIPLGALVLGGLLLLARREYALVVYVALSFAAICATPFQTQFVRYLLPLYPFLALAMFEFLAWVTARVRLRWPALPQALAAAVRWAVLAVIAPRATIEVARAVRKPPPAGVVRPAWAAGQLPALLLRPGERRFRRSARLAGRACGARRRARRRRPAVGLSPDRPANACCRRSCSTGEKASG